MLSARCREPRPSQFSPRLQVRVISTSTSNIHILKLFGINKKVTCEKQKIMETSQYSGMAVSSRN